MMVVKWDKEKIDWLLKNYSYEKRKEVAKRFCNKFEYISHNGIMVAYNRFIKQENNE